MARFRFLELSGRLTAFCLLALLCEPVAAQVQDLYRINDGRFEAHVRYQQAKLAPGEEVTLGDLTGPAKITYFYFTDDGHFHPNEPEGTTYPGLVLKVYWDDASKPSILIPLWNFFGSFLRKTVDYQSLLMQINHYCYMSYLPMPFSKRARFVLANDGNVTYSRLIAWGIDYEKSVAFANESSRLHAAWQRSNPTRDSVHTLLDIKGRGHYVGNFLQVSSNYDGWWGEGDTVFAIDGEEITHSPGTEDEYGSTWFFERVFSSPYSGYIQMEGQQNRMYRWYLANPVRFQKSLRVRIQNQRFQLKSDRQGADAREAFKHGQTPSQDDYTSVVFWYQEGAHPAPALLPYAERIAPSKGANYTSQR